MCTSQPPHVGASHASYKKSPWPLSWPGGAPPSRTVHSQKGGPWKRPAKALEADPEHLGQEFQSPGYLDLGGEVGLWPLRGSVDLLLSRNF